MRQKTVCFADKPHKHSGAHNGQSIIEFALIVPVLAVILIGVLDLGRMYYAYMTVVNAAREGARWAAAHPPLDCVTQESNGVTSIVNHTRNETDQSGIMTSELDVFVSCPKGLDPTDPFGAPIRVEVTYNFKMVTSSMLGAGPITLKSAAQMQIFAHKANP